MFVFKCRLVFREFDEEFIGTFIQLCEEYDYQNLRELQFDDPVTINPDLKLGDEVQNLVSECLFSFRLIVEEGRRLENNEKYQQLSLAFEELTHVFEHYRKDYITQGLPDTATVALLVFSQNIYPRHFNLANVFCMKKVGFGSIVRKRTLAPSFFYDQSEIDQELFQSYLREQRDINERFDSNMLLCFEHDRDMFTVCFPDVIKGVTAKEGRSLNRIVDLRVAYSSIRRIIVTPQYDKENDEYNAIFVFQVSYPPAIHIYEEHKVIEDENNPRRRRGPMLRFKPPQRFLTFNPGLDILNCMSHASCLITNCHGIDPKDLFNVIDRIRRSITSAVEFRCLEWRPQCLIKNYEHHNFFMDPDTLPEEFERLKDPKYFPLVYAIQALISRGGEIYEYFFRQEFGTFEGFLRSMINFFEADLRKDPGGRVTKTVVTLENMLQEIDRRNDIPEPHVFFTEMLNGPVHQTVASITDELNREGYMRVRKLIITPTRRLFLNPELIMGNRSLRKRGADSMLRVVFRDDDNRKVTGLPGALIQSTVAEPMRNTLNVGFQQFSYLCSSNSQLRDHGTYFLAGTPDDAKQFLRKCGKFKFEAIPKMMSRIGQCFTQSRPLGIEIEWENYSDRFDYVGGQDSSGKPYTFSDGVGMMSCELRDRVVQDFRIRDCKPSCFQIRFKGYKGIVVVNSLMDETKDYAITIGKPPVFKKGERFPWYAQSLIFRPSQNKFNSPKEKFVEIVKISAPIAVSLNKPLINILDQCSEMHGSESHYRMCSRISELMENHVATLINSLIEEPHAFLALNEFPQYIFYDKLRNFNVTEEPFFRSMLRSSALVSLYKLVDKMQIRIPAAEGRMAFGVVDESGLLQYGQVFFQYTTNAALKYPDKHAQKTVHTGPIMVTKNPSIVSGDVRMFEAVDLPCMHDLVDVIVFPQSGPRPHPDEMAGSDLDGDEYSIFWDPRLFLDRNEPAFDFTAMPAEAPSETEEEVRAKLTDLMIDFFTKYVAQDSIGTIANAHLANSDLYGINSELCHQIALKHNQAVDFPKTGQVPEPLIKSWQDDFPPERPEKFPNFMSKATASAYKSVRLLSSLHNRAMEIKEIIRVEDIASVDETIRMDESVVMEKDHMYEDEARDAYEQYSVLIGGLCENYGIANEGQLFCGKFFTLKKRVSDKDDDNMAYYNTQHMIEKQVAAIYSRFRVKFFKSFGGIERHTVLDDRMYGNGENIRRICEAPGPELRKKASAYYRVAYSDGKFLSFPWIVSDILSYSRQIYLLDAKRFRYSLFPLEDCLSNYINQLCASDMYKLEFKRYKNLLEKSQSTQKSTTDVSQFVANICHTFIGLDKLLFFVRKWILWHRIENIRPKVIDAVVCLYGMGELKKGDTVWLTSGVVNDGMHKYNLEEQIGGLGRRFWLLIKYLMTRSFGFSERISLKAVSKGKHLESEQCISLYFAAESTFYPIAINRRFDSLPGTSEQKVINKVTESGIFVVEIPKNVHDEKRLMDKLALKCGCTYLDIRRKPDRINAKSCRIALKPVGSYIAVKKFKGLLQVSPRMDEQNLQLRSDLIAYETYQRLLFYTAEQNSVDEPYESILAGLEQRSAEIAAEIFQ